VQPDPGRARRVFLWHVHGSWTTALVQGRHRYLVPVLPDRGPDGRGRARTWDWPASVSELSPDEAVWFCREVEPLDMYLVEDPIRAEHPQGYRRIREQTNVPIAAGEQWANKWEFRQVIEEELIDYARIDICIAASPTFLIAASP